MRPSGLSRALVPGVEGLVVAEAAAGVQDRLVQAGRPGGEHVRGYLVQVLSRGGGPAPDGRRESGGPHVAADVGTVVAAGQAHVDAGGVVRGVTLCGGRGAAVPSA